MPSIELLAALTCLTKLLTRAVIMASHFLSRDCFSERCCMEAPLSSVQEHALKCSSMMYYIYIHRYMGRSTSAPYCLGLNTKLTILTSWLTSVQTYLHRFTSSSSGPNLAPRFTFTTKTLFFLVSFHPSLLYFQPSGLKRSNLISMWRL